MPSDEKTIGSSCVLSWRADAETFHLIFPRNKLCRANMILMLSETMLDPRYNNECKEDVK